MWIQGDLDLDLYDEDYERMGAIIWHTKHWYDIKTHGKNDIKTVVGTKYHAQFHGGMPQGKKKAIMELPLPMFS